MPDKKKNSASSMLKDGSAVYDQKSSKVPSKPATHAEAMKSVGVKPAKKKSLSDRVGAALRSRIMKTTKADKVKKALDEAKSR